MKTTKDKDKPINWKGLCKEHWYQKQMGWLLEHKFISDEHCWNCGKPLNFNEKYHYESSKLQEWLKNGI